MNEIKEYNQDDVKKISEELSGYKKMKSISTKFNVQNVKRWAEEIIVGHSVLWEEAKDAVLDAGFRIDEYDRINISVDEAYRLWTKGIKNPPKYKRTEYHYFTYYRQTLPETKIERYQAIFERLICSSCHLYFSSFSFHTSENRKSMIKIGKLREFRIDRLVQAYKKVKKLKSKSGDIKEITELSQIEYFKPDLVDVTIALIEAGFDEPNTHLFTNFSTNDLVNILYWREL